MRYKCTRNIFFVKSKKWNKQFKSFKRLNEYKGWLFSDFLKQQQFFLKKSEKQNVNEEKSQNSMIALALILVLTFCTGRRTIIEPSGDGFDGYF